MEIVRQLIDMGADRTCSDKNVRPPVHPYPVLSFNLSLSLHSYGVVNVFVAILGSHGVILRGAQRQ